MNGLFKLLVISLGLLIFSTGCSTGGGSDSSSDTDTTEVNTTVSSDTGAADDTPENNETVSIVVSSAAEPVISDLIVFLPNSTMTTTAPNEEKNIRVLLVDQNSEGIEGTVTISRLYDENMTDYGSFALNSVETSNAEATLLFTSPGIEPANGVKSVTIRATSSDFTLEKNISIVYSYTQQTDYKLFTVYAANSDAVSLEEKHKFTFFAADVSDSTDRADDSNITSMSVQVLTPSLSYLTEGDMDELMTITTQDHATTTVNFHTRTKSGIALLEVNATVNDGSNEYNISKIFDFVILSGPVSSLGISYIDSAYSDGLFKNRYVVQAVDKYGNKANDGEKISVGVISGVRIDSDGDGLFVDKNGTISTGVAGADLTLDNTLDYDLSSVDINDRVAILSNEIRSRYEYTGGWEIDSISGSTLSFAEQFDYDSNDSLSFVIGNEYRYDSCGMTQANVLIDEESGEYTINDGKAVATLSYPPFFVGKDLYFYANAYANDKKLGTAIRKKLWGAGVSAESVTITGPAAGSGVDGYSTVQEVQLRLVQTTSGASVSNISTGLVLSDSCYNEDNTTISSKAIASTGCSGTMSVQFKTKEDESCTVSWNGSINYEY